MAGYQQGNSGYGGGQGGAPQGPYQANPGSGSLFVAKNRTPFVMPDGKAIPPADLSGKINLSPTKGGAENWLNATFKCPQGNEQAVADILRIMAQANVRLQVKVGKPAAAQQQGAPQGQQGGYQTNSPPGGYQQGAGGQQAPQGGYGSQNPQTGSYGAPPQAGGYGQQAGPPQGGYQNGQRSAPQGGQQTAMNYGSARGGRIDDEVPF